MPRTLFVTQGEFAGRYMRLEDDVADQALADGWARENEQESPEEEEASAEKRRQQASGEAQQEPEPESLTSFENPPETQASEGEEPDNDEPTPHRRKRRSS